MRLRHPITPATVQARACHPEPQALLRRQRGFSLVEMALVLAIVGLLGALFLPATNTMLDNSRRKETRAKLEAVQMALTRFVMTNQRLPCPADGSLAAGNANQGLELAAGGACTAAALTNGVVPWRTLAIPQNDVTDAWNMLISYKVWGGAGVVNSLTLAAPNNMDMSALDPTSVGAVLAWLSGRGFRVCNTTPCAVAAAGELASKTAGNGVAYFLISHGANKVGGYTPNGTLITTANGAGPGPSENINLNGVALRTNAAAATDFYIDADYNENVAAYYDDIVLRPTVMQAVMAAGLGPSP